VAIEYKFIELSIVTDETIEEAVNALVRQGWHWDGIRFVTTESSRRPQMAFVSFVREAPERGKAKDKEKEKDKDGEGQAGKEIAEPRPGPRLVTD
jgi:hypothetical protein